MAENVDEVMQQIPLRWRYHWCEAGLCACIGCVKTGNKKVMAEVVKGSAYRGDPEYIDEGKIPEQVSLQYKVTREEWEDWVKENPRPESLDHGPEANHGEIRISRPVKLR